MIAPAAKEMQKVGSELLVWDVCLCIGAEELLPRNTRRYSIIFLLDTDLFQF